MEWLLLYPLVGVAIFPWMLHYEVKYSGMARDDWLMMLLPLFVIWPILVILVPREWPQGKRDLTERKRNEAEREFQALETRVRREARARVKQEFAEFDKELGIEPEWKKAHPSAAMEWEIAYEDQFRVRDLQRYSEGGRV